MPNDEHLIDFINSTAPEKLQVEEDLGFGFVRLNITEAHRRQAKDDIQCVEDALIELLRNCRDANAKNIYVANWRQENLRNIIIFDDGDGIPESLVDKIFEPRVTSKLNKIKYDHYGLHGRGMALYSIWLNCSKASVLYSKPGKGAIIRIAADTDGLPEKANQSTWPTLNNKNQITNGPKNIIRTCLEFNLGHKDLNLYLGTPSEILCLLREHGLFGLNTDNPKRLFDKSNELNLSLSLRNCQRVYYGDINKIRSILQQINFNAKKPNKKINNSYLKTEELNHLLKEIESLVNDKISEYFLKVSESANINKVGNKLNITLPLETEE